MAGSSSTTRILAITSPRRVCGTAIAPPTNDRLIAFSAPFADQGIMAAMRQERPTKV
jgi:hypothetical protein